MKEQRNGGWPDGNMTKLYSRQVVRARLEFDASRALKSLCSLPFFLDNVLVDVQHGLTPRHSLFIAIQPPATEVRPCKFSWRGG